MFTIAGSSSTSYFHKCAVKSLTPSVECIRPGANAELLGFTLNKAGIPYKVLSKIERKKLFSGTVTDALKAGIVDTSSGKYLITESKTKEFDFSYPIEQMEPVFVVAKRTRSLFESALMPIYNFDGYMWFCVCAAFFALIIALFIFRKLGKNNQDISTIGQYLSHGVIYGFHSRNESTISGNMAAVLLGVIALLITRLYCAGLLAVLLHPPSVAPFKDSWEMLNLVENNELSIVVSSNTSWLMDEMRLSNHTYYKRLRQVTKSNPIKAVGSSENRIEMVKNEKFIMPLMNNVRTVKLLQKHCELTFVTGNDLPIYWVGFLFKKNSVWLHLFNKALAETREGVESLNKKYTTTSSVCKQNVVRGGKPLDMYSMSGVGVLLLFGFIIASIVLVIEKFRAKYSNGNIEMNIGENSKSGDSAAFT